MFGNFFFNFVLSFKLRQLKLKFQVTKSLCHEFLKSGRTLITDNFFTSTRLGKYLAANQTYLVGTLRKSRSENPDVFMSEIIPVWDLQLQNYDNFNQLFEYLLNFRIRKWPSYTEAIITSMKVL
jgi:hypothetical protein